MIADLAFYVFSACAIVAATMVVVAKNPVHSVLLLILTFFSASGLFVLLGAEFLAMVLIVVYVGAVSVLMIFVVMMLDINFSILRKGFQRYLPFGIMIGCAILAQFVMIALFEYLPANRATGDQRLLSGEVSNTLVLGQQLFTDYILVFQSSGFVLLLAMVGAIVLTLRARSGVKRQVIGRQTARSLDDSIEVKKFGS